MPFIKDGTWKNASDMVPGDYEEDEKETEEEYYRKRNLYPDYLPDNYDPDPDPDDD